MYGTLYHQPVLNALVGDMDDVMIHHNHEIVINSKNDDAHLCQTSYTPHPVPSLPVPSPPSHPVLFPLHPILTPSKSVPPHPPYSSPLSASPIHNSPLPSHSPPLPSTQLTSPIPNSPLPSHCSPLPSTTHLSHPTSNLPIPLCTSGQA